MMLFKEPIFQEFPMRKCNINIIKIYDNGLYQPHHLS